jgi:hypothetical protein
MVAVMTTEPADEAVTVALARPLTVVTEEGLRVPPEACRSTTVPSAAGETVMAKVEESEPPARIASVLAVMATD